MNTERISSLVKGCGLGATAMLALLGVTARAFADPPVTMAPPSATSADATADDAGSDTVFQWSEVPQDKRVPLTRAVFDQSGYQLYDTVGETILVPFADNNLYVMKFAPSDDGTLYVVNDGDAPVLYVPKNGYLENASVSGARWYPFGKDFHPAHPVYLGVAPSWDAFVSIGWAPDVVIRGGYWSRSSFISGGIFLPSAGLVFQIGGHAYDGWEPYHDYVIGHRDHFRFVGGDAGYHRRVFRGAGPGYGHDGGRFNRDEGRFGHGDGWTPGRAEGGHRSFRGARGDYRRDRR